MRVSTTVILRASPTTYSQRFYETRKYIIVFTKARQWTSEPVKYRPQAKVK